jgi:tripartite-type tricarboxylate transporter receptor subunit TctC
MLMAFSKREPRMKTIEPEIPAAGRLSAHSGSLYWERWAVNIFAIGAVTAIVVMMLTGAWAQDWPQRPVTLVIPYPVGGTVDTQARILGERLWAKLGQPFVIQNRAGAAGALGTGHVAHANADGDTLLFASSAQISSVPKLQAVNYSVDDLIPISLFSVFPMILATNSRIPANSLKQFVDYVKFRPGKFTYASGGVGTIAHLVGALFVARTGLDMLHVPYQGGGPAVTGLLGGQVDMYFGNASELMGFAQDKQVRLIGVSAAQRMRQLPDVPAVDELLPGFELTPWNGLLAPAGTPQTVIDVLAKATSEVAMEPAVIVRLNTLGIDARGSSSADFVEVIRKEQHVYEEAIKAAGLTGN